MRLVIAIIVGVVAFAGNISADQEVSMIGYSFPNCPDYRLVTTLAANQDSLEAMYFIGRRDTMVWPPETVTLDSIRAVYATATDTNTFIFVCAEGQTNHLVVVKTSPTVQFDTLMSQGIAPPDNWLANPEIVTISPNFGIVAGNFEHGFSSGIYDIRRMNKDGTTSLLHTIENAKHMRVSLDRNEFYFPILEDWDGFAYYNLHVYDVAADSFYVLKDPPFSIDTPFRSTKSSPLYYVKALRINNELWRMMPDGSHKLAYSLNRWENFESIDVTMDSLVVVISRRIYSESTYKLVFHHQDRRKFQIVPKDSI